MRSLAKGLVNGQDLPVLAQAVRDLATALRARDVQATCI